MSKQSIILIVGADGVGKTNIAQALSKQLEIPVFKNPMEWYRDLSSSEIFINLLRYSGPVVAEFLNQTGVSVIFDRAYPCEYAYAQAYNRKTDYHILTALDEIYAKLGAKIIFCYHDQYFGYVDRKDKKYFSDADQINIDNGYMKFLKETKCEYLMLETSDNDLGRELKEIIHFLYFTECI